MDKDTYEWVEAAIRLCQRAKEQGVAILLRNDDEEIIATNLTAAADIRALAEGLAAGYGTEEE